MNSSGMLQSIASTWVLWALATVVAGPVFAKPETSEPKMAEEETFPLLQIGTHTYTNVTVTTRAKDYIFIRHAGGLMNIKAADLPEELQERWGYANPKSKAHAPVTATPVNLTMAKVKDFDVKLQKAVLSEKNKWLFNQLLVSRMFGIVLLAILVLLYLFRAYCYMLVCRKAGGEPGVLVWLPVLNAVPLLKAAGMSAWWILGYLVFPIGIVVHIMFSVKIVKARGKGTLAAILMVLPITTPFAFLYLAFSSAASPREQPRVEMMTLQTS